MTGKLARMVAAVCVMLLITLAPQPSMAVEPSEVLKDPALEERARKLSLGLRCLVCQNQSIDDSDAPLAKDLRVLVRERLTQGDSDKEVIDFVVARYGEYVLLNPRLKTSTLILWFATPLVLLLATFFLLRARRSASTPQAATAAAPLSRDEKQRLDRLLDNDDA